MAKPGFDCMSVWHQSPYTIHPSPDTLFLLLLILWTQIPICNPYLCRVTRHQVWITRTFCVSHLRPSTLNANQAAFLVPFTQAHAQNLALHIFHNAKGQDQKHSFLLKAKNRDIEWHNTIFFCDPPCFLYNCGRWPPLKEK